MINLNARALTPNQVLSACLEVPEVTDAYVILVKEDGSFDLRGSGDLSKLPGAALYIQHYATEYARGRIEVE